MESSESKLELEIQYQLYMKLKKDIEYKIENLTNTLVYGISYKEGDVQRIRGQILGFESALKLLKEALQIA